MGSSAIVGPALVDLKNRYQDGSVVLNYGMFSPTVTVTDNIVNASLGANFSVLGSGNRTVNIHNIKDGQSLTILVSGAAGNVISFQAYEGSGATPLTIQFGSAAGTTMVSTYSLFTIYRIGGSLNLVVLFACHLA